MFKKLQAKLRNKKGFTLVELLIVIAVLGIIAAIAVPRFTGVLGGVKSKADISSAAMWSKDIEAQFVVGNWDIPDAGYIITSAAKQGYKGDVPTSSSDSTKTYYAVITKSGTAPNFEYNLKITIGDAAGTSLFNKNISGPIN